MNRIARTIPAAQRGRTWLIVLIAIPLGLLLLFALYTWATLSFDYSDGERAGYVQKLSRKGWVCKTWEGDLAMVNLPGQPAEIFSFSVRDDAVAQRIEALVGKRVALKYEEHIGVPTNCFGETRYFVVDVREVKLDGVPN